MVCLVSTATNFIVGGRREEKVLFGKQNKKHKQTNRKPLLFLPLAGSFCQSVAIQTGDYGFGTPQGGNVPTEVKGGKNKEPREEISKGRAGVKGSKNVKMMPQRVTLSRTPWATLVMPWGYPRNQQMLLGGVRTQVSAQRHDRLGNGNRPCSCTMLLSLCSVPRSDFLLPGPSGQVNKPG